jgi:nucleoside-diphosphate-sugar epimerase
MKILVTGATGRIGPHVIDQLLAEGIDCRIAGLEPSSPWKNVDWVQLDLCNADQDKIDSAVLGVDVIIHLAAELKEIALMNEVNVEATNKLGLSAEKLGVKRFVYASSVCVYGFPRIRIINEQSPTLDVNGRLDHPYAADRYLYDYAVTKLRGEVGLSAVLKRCELVILRFACVNDEKQQREVLNIGIANFLWRANRNAHYIYVKDIADAVCYSSHKMKLSSGREVFIVSEDNMPDNTTGALFVACGKHRVMYKILLFLKPVISVLDDLKDRMKYRSWKMGYPVGRVIYSPAKLLSSGYKHKFGIRRIQYQLASSISEK